MRSLRLAYQRYCYLMNCALHVRDPVERKHLITRANKVLSFWFNMVDREADDRMAQSK